MAFAGENNLEKLLELAAGVGIDGAEADPHDQALVRTLLSICMGQYPASGFGLAPPLPGAAQDDDLTIPLLRTIGGSTGIVQSLGLQALKTWVDLKESCIIVCVRQGCISLLLNILSDALPAAGSSLAAAYTSSMAVINLRMMIRKGGDEAAASLIQSDGIRLLMRLIADPKLDTRSTCLSLYLLNDLTRRSIDILDHALTVGAFSPIIFILRQPISDSTKYAALILNRWALAGQYVASAHAAGASDALFHVLVACYAEPVDSIDSEAVAYALSAICILFYDASDALRSRLLECADELAAFSKAIMHYEQCFQGVGFPHAVMILLLDGPRGADLILSLATSTLLPLWLVARQAGPHLASRAAESDVTHLFQQLRDPSGVRNVIIGVTNLLQASPALIAHVLQPGRLELLAQGALAELASEGSGVFGEAAFQANDQWGEPSKVVGGLDFSGTIPNQAEAQAGVDESDLYELADLLSPMSVPSAESDLLCSLVTVTPMEEACSGITEDSQPLMVLPPATPARTQSATTGFSSPAPVLHLADGAPCISAVARLVRSADGNSNALYYHDKRAATHLQTPRFPREEVNVPRYDTLRFLVGGREVHAVGFVLEAHSPFLRGLLGAVNDVRESVTVPMLAGFSPQVMHKMFTLAVEWCYTDSIHDGFATAEDLFSMWQLADFLQMDGLQRYCEQQVFGLMSLQPNVVGKCLAFAESYPSSSSHLRRLAARYLLTLIVDQERSMFHVTTIAAAISTHIAPLAAELANELRHVLCRNFGQQIENSNNLHH